MPPHRWALASLFFITDISYRKLTLEFLAAFKLERWIINFHRPSTVQFQVFKVIHQMSLTKFLAHVELYDEAFTWMPEYDALLI